MRLTRKWDMLRENGCVKLLGDAEKPALLYSSCPVPCAGFAERLELEGKQRAL